LHSYTLDQHHHRINHQADRVDTLLRLRCALRNVPRMAHSPSYLFGQVPPGTAIILCAHGASLLSQIDLLKPVSDKVLIIATARAAMAMIEEGVFPRMVVAESSWAEHFWQSPVHLDHSWLITVPEIDPVMTQTFDHILWMQSAHSEISGLMNRLGFSLPQYKSSSRNEDVLLLDVARSLHGEKIALLGFDYCLDSYGRFFPEKERPENEPVMNVAGVDGRSVSSVHSLLAGREVFQDYVAKKMSAPARIFNCAKRGADVEGVSSMRLDDFLKGSDAYISRYPLFQEQNSSLEISGNGALLLEVLARLRQVAASFSLIAQRKKGHLPILRQEIQNMMGSGRVLLAEIAAVLQNAIDSVDDNEWETASRFASSLATEMALELERAIHLLFKQNEDQIPSVSSVHHFSSLKTLGSDLIRRNNYELADFLQRGENLEWSPEFAVSWAGQTTPFIEHLVHNEYIPITERMDGSHRAIQDIERFVERTGFAVDKNALVLLGGLDWIHIHEFVRLYPEIKIMVVEPWLSLLAMQLERADLLSDLPADLLVIGMTAQQPSWSINYSQRINLWRAQQRTPVFFVAPALRRVKKIRECYDKLTGNGAF